MPPHSDHGVGGPTVPRWKVDELEAEITRLKAHRCSLDPIAVERDVATDEVRVTWRDLVVIVIDDAHVFTDLNLTDAIPKLREELDEWVRTNGKHIPIVPYSIRVETAQKPPRKPRLTRTIVTISGSTRFIGLMAIAAFEEEKAGRLAMACHLLPRWYKAPGGEPVQDDHQAEHEGVDKSLDTLHLNKISMSHELLVIDMEGYIGESTKREIEHAKRCSVPVRYVSTERPDWFVRHVEPGTVIVGPGGDFSCSMCKWAEADCRCPVELNR